MSAIQDLFVRARRLGSRLLRSVTLGRRGNPQPTRSPRPGLPDITPEFVERAVGILGNSLLSPSEVDAQLIDLAGDRILVNRLIGILPETFAIVLVSHMKDGLKVKWSRKFSVRNAKGKWTKIRLSEEPIFAHGLRLAFQMYHQGPRDVFAKMATQSATADSVNRALHAGESLAGAKCSFVVHGVPAEEYGA